MNPVVKPDQNQNLVTNQLRLEQLEKLATTTPDSNPLARCLYQLEARQ